MALFRCGGGSSLKPTVINWFVNGGDGMINIDREYYGDYTSVTVTLSGTPTSITYHNSDTINDWQGGTNITNNMTIPLAGSEKYMVVRMYATGGINADLTFNP